MNAVADCIPDETGTRCIVCGRPKPQKAGGWPRRNCTGPRIRGPGDFLHDAILKWVGEGPTPECGCTDRINQMNAWGPAGCREHLDEIVGWLVEQATQRDWWKHAVSVPGSRYFIKRMVLGAIKRATPPTDAARQI